MGSGGPAKGCPDAESTPLLVRKFCDLLERLLAVGRSEELWRSGNGKLHLGPLPRLPRPFSRLSEDSSMKTLFFVLAASMILRAAAPITLANFPNSMVYAVQTDTGGNLYVAGFQGNFNRANPFVAN